MQTHLASFIKNTATGEEAERILQTCVHCGMCTATCPTYQLLGDELDGPRGRIYQIKQVLEGAPATPQIQQHLDRCLTCRSCETTCPSGVQYGRLLDIGREVVQQQVPRKPSEQRKREVLRRLMLSPTLFYHSYRLAQHTRRFLPASVRSKIMPLQKSGTLPNTTHSRQMIMLTGCVQPAMSPNINAATLRVFDALNIQLHRPAEAGCCGAINLHNNHATDGLSDMRRNINAWWPLIQQGAEAIIINASGCGVTVKEYGYHLRHDRHYATKAAEVSRLAKDIVEVLNEEKGRLKTLLHQPQAQTLAYHPPCTLQHGMKLKGSVEALLHELGMQVFTPRDAHLCCGSAGTYSLFQPDISQRLKQDKLSKLAELKPDVILSANIGCISHLTSSSTVPVIHWIEYLDSLLH